MTSIEVENLLAPVEEESPCGPSLTYDPVYIELEKAAQGTPERVMGDSTIPAEEPDWAKVERHSLELLGRTKDLHVLLPLAAAALRNQGIPGLHSALRLMRETLERYWEQVHPHLDPDDDNDPTERMNIIASLAAPQGTIGDPYEFLKHIREAPLSNSAMGGRFSLRDIGIANGETAPSGELAEIPDPALINGAFDDTETDHLTALIEAAEGAREEMKRIDQLLMEVVGSMNAPDLSKFDSAIAEVVTCVQGHLARRGIGEAVEAQDGGDGQAGPRRISGEIRSREDVVSTLDKVCRYYETNEPSSPIPLLLRRARRLVAKSYVEIVQDLTPGAMSEVETIGGQNLTSSGESE